MYVAKMKILAIVLCSTMQKTTLPMLTHPLLANLQHVILISHVDRNIQAYVVVIMMISIKSYRHIVISCMYFIGRLSKKIFSLT